MSERTIKETIMAELKLILSANPLTLRRLKPTGHRGPYIDKNAHFLDLSDTGYIIFIKTTEICLFTIK